MRPLRPLFVASLLAVAAAAQAQIGLGNIASQASNALKNFDIADKNHDGLLTREEAEKGPVPFIRAHFDQSDKDKRGTVSKLGIRAGDRIISATTTRKAK